MVIPCQIELAALTVQEMYLSLLHPALLSCETYSYIWEIAAQNILYPSTCIFVFLLLGLIVSFYFIYDKISRIRTSKTYYKHLPPEKNSGNRWLHCQKSFPQKTPVILLSNTLHNSLEITPEKPFIPYSAGQIHRPKITIIYFYIWVGLRTRLTINARGSYFPLECVKIFIFPHI